jgi:hypothetical protein
MDRAAGIGPNNCGGLGSRRHGTRSEQRCIPAPGSIVSYNSEAALPLTGEQQTLSCRSCTSETVARRIGSPRGLRRSRLKAEMASSNYLWHHDLHRRAASERLYFFAFEFYPNYDQTIAVGQIKTALRANRIVSYVVWELLGNVDLLVKLWVPSQVDLATLKSALADSISYPHQFRMVPFSVERTLHHWLWPDEITDGGRLPDLPHRLMVSLNGPSPPTATAVKPLVDNGLVHRLRSQRTMKFFVRITPGDARSDGDDLYLENELNNRVCSVVHRAADIMSPSIFLGDGFARYLITGRVDPRKWETISTQLVDSINDLGMNLYRGKRTLTHVSAFADAVDRREQLLAADSVNTSESLTLDDLLAREESRTLEFKASAFMNVTNAVRNRDALKPDIRMQDTIVKAVTGMLNAVGGIIAIGVAESSEFTLDELGTIYNTPEAQGNYIVVGVQQEYPRKAWDGYERRLRQLLARHIEPDPSGWIEFERADHTAGPVALVLVRRPDGWFFARGGGKSLGSPRFAARIGNETLWLEGRAMDEYRESNPRTTAR